MFSHHGEFAQTHRYHRNTMTETNKGLPISLKGITSTNDDPSRCAICSGPFPKGPYHSVSILHGCCGKRVCDSCIDKFGILYRNNCVKCGTDSARFDGLLKKNAKKGQAWAQETIGRYFYYGDPRTSSFTKSYYDAIRWFRKAATNGHPLAMIFLGEMYANGFGCERDLTLARMNLERAISADAMVADAARESLVNVAELYQRGRDYDTAISILLPLADLDVTLARHNLAIVFCNTGEYQKSLTIYSKMVSEGHSGLVGVSVDALSCCAILGKFPQARFWLSIATRNLHEVLSMQQETAHVFERVTLLRSNLREIRNGCGGCGAPLIGTMRKKCAGCRTYCYCSRDCQKMHWNRSGSAHREECKEVMELKENLKKARKAKNKTAE